MLVLCSIAHEMMLLEAREMWSPLHGEHKSPLSLPIGRLTCGPEGPVFGHLTAKCSRWVIQQCINMPEC